MVNGVILHGKILIYNANKPSKSIKNIKKSKTFIKAVDNSYIGHKVLLYYFLFLKNLI